MAKHPGFKAVQSQIAAREGISGDRAGASPAAKKKNPRLKRVKGSSKRRVRRSERPEERAEGDYGFLERDRD